MKILLSAYSCLPNCGSEPGIGWNWAEGIANLGHQVFVITRADKREIIEEECKRRAIQNPQFLFHDLPPLLQKLYQLPFGNYAYYTLWQYSAAKYAAQVHEKEKFDQVHHITWGSFRLPSFMGNLGIPFVFGPVAGGEDTPRKLRRGLGWRGRLWDFARRASNLLLTRTPLMSATYGQATQVVATTRETLREIPARYRHKVIVQQAVGIDPKSLHAGSCGCAGASGSLKKAKLNLLFVGRLLPWKGLHLGLKALAPLRTQCKDVHLTVVGSGADETRLKRLAAQLSIHEYVSWIPWMKREELIQLYPEFDVFLFPSLHDSGGIAVLEAMSLGLPVLCLDLGGPGVSVNSSCGKAIQAEGRSEEELVAEMSSYLTELLGDPSVLESLAAGAQRRVASLSWQAAINGVYGSFIATARASETLAAQREVNP
jgi:glycosyltransferase involved in cell wall biosynthesis